MAAGLLIFPGAFPSRDRQGDRVAARIAFYENGAPGTPKTVYSDVGLTTPLANPVLSDALGKFPAIYADTDQEFTAIWSTIETDPQSETLDDLTPSTSANQTVLDQTEAARDQTLVYRDEAEVLKGQTQDALDDALALYGGMAAVDAAVTAAAGSATSASGSATTATTQAGISTTQAGISTTQAGIATTQAGNAATFANQAKGYVAGAAFNFSTTTTDSDPGSGNIRLNNATPSAATIIYVDDLDADGASVGSWIDTFDDSSSAVKGQLFLKDGATGAQAVYSVNGSVINGTGYRKIPVAWVENNGALSNGLRLGLTFARTGDVSATSSVGYAAKTANYTIVASDWGRVIDITSGSPTISYTAAGTLGNGFWHYIKNRGAGIVTLPTIDGVARTLFPGEMAMVECDGANFHWIWLHTAPGPHFHARDEKVVGTNGGNSTAGSWVTRDVNTVLRNVLTASLASNKITLPAGNYRIEASAPAYTVSAHRLRLYNDTDGSQIGLGQNAASGSVDTTMTTATLSLEFTLAASRAIRIDHYTGFSVTNGFGLASGVDTEVYADVKIWRLPE
jgi:hypothetical protein